MNVSSLSNFISPYSEAIHAKAAAVINLSAILLLPQRTAAGAQLAISPTFSRERKKEMEGGEFPRFFPFYLISRKISKEFFFPLPFSYLQTFSLVLMREKISLAKKSFFCYYSIPCRQGKRLKSDLPNASRKRKKVSYSAAIERSAAAPFFANSANVISRIKKFFFKKKKERHVRFWVSVERVSNFGKRIDAHGKKILRICASVGRKHEN